MRTAARIALILSLLLTALGLAAPPGHAGTIAFTFTLDGSQVVPPSGSEGVAAGVMLVDEDTGELSFTGGFSGLNGDVTAADIRVGPIGANGPPLYPLTSPGIVGTGAKSGPITGNGPSLPPDPENEEMLLRGELHIQIETTQGVEIRGQLVRQGTRALGGPIDGTQEGTGSPGDGALTVQFDPAANAVTFGGVYSGLDSNITAAHLHRGAPGVAGPIVYDLVTNGHVATGATSGTVQGTGVLPAAEADDLLAGDLYINLHTVNDPGGAIRGQLVPAFTCDLFGGDGNDIIVGTKEPDTICGLGGADNLIGKSGGDLLIGSDGNDVLIGGAGGDDLRGHRGRDHFRPGKGADLVDGGDDEPIVGDHDEVSYRDAAAGADVSIDLGLGTVISPVMGDDTLVEIEHAEGGPGNDMIVGSDGRNILTGREGSDEINGGDGNDLLIGNAGDDSLNGGPGNDLLQPGLGTDSVEGGGATTTDGVYYTEMAGPVQVDLSATPPVAIDGGGSTDTLDAGVLNVFGSKGNDVLIGGPGPNGLFGQGGNDDIHVEGDPGFADFAHGGPGTDTCARNAEDTADSSCEGDVVI